MNEKYMLPKESIKNIVVDGLGVGIEFKVGIPYYRGVMLSMIDRIIVKYDDLEIPQEQLKFTTGDCTYSMQEMETITTLRWEFGEFAKVSFPFKGGFELGTHKLEVSVAIRMSYGMRIPVAYTAVQYVGLICD